MMSVSDTPVSRSATARLSAWLLITMFIVILVGGILTKTEIVARGIGKVVPISRLQVVQPPADGKIVVLNVAEGQTVNAGDILIKLDTSVEESNVQRIVASLEQQFLDFQVANTIIALLSSTDPSRPEFVEYGIRKFHEFTPKNSETKKTGEALVGATLIALRDQILQSDSRLKQLELEQEIHLAKIARIKIDRDLVVQKLSSAEKLVKRGILSRNEHLEKLRELQLIESNMQVAEREFSAVVASTDVARHQRLALISENLATQFRRARESEIASSASTAALHAAKELLANLTLRAPVSGRIENLSVHTLGGFVREGATLMSVVPNQGEMEIEAFFENRDVGFLEVGQKAHIKFDAFPSERFGVVTAYVDSIGADARQDKSTKWVYAVRLKFEKPSLDIDGKLFPFSPGMTSTIDIVTSERRIISYFFEPITKAIQNGLRER